MLALFVFIYQVEGHIVVPNVMANALRLHPLLVIFGLLASGELYGIPGVLMALPPMAAARAIWEFSRSGSGSTPGTSRCRWRRRSRDRVAPPTCRSGSAPRRNDSGPPGEAGRCRS